MTVFCMSGDRSPNRSYFEYVHSSARKKRRVQSRIDAICDVVGIADILFSFSKEAMGNKI